MSRLEARENHHHILPYQNTEKEEQRKHPVPPIAQHHQQQQQQQHVFLHPFPMTQITTIVSLKLSPTFDVEFHFLLQL